MSLIALLCSLPVALVGAYYLVNAGAVAWLGGFEGQGANQVRVRLRRANGVVMLLTSLALYLGIARTFDRAPDEPVSVVAPVAWLATLPLLMLMLVFAWLDMRLTRKLKRDLLRKAVMKNSPDSGKAPLSNGAAPLLAILAGSLLAGGVPGCDQTSAQPPNRPAQGSPATHPATKSFRRRTSAAAVSNVARLAPIFTMSPKSDPCRAAATVNKKKKTAALPEMEEGTRRSNGTAIGAASSTGMT